MASEIQEPIYRFTAEHARNYDEGIRVAGLGYNVLHDLTGALLGSLLPAQAQVLVVGAGTGEEIVQLGTRYPGWCFTGIDPSAEMLAVARQRIAEAGLTDRVTLHVGTVDGLPMDDRYDAATLLLVMHFLPDDGAKLALLRGIAERLRPGAPLVLADLHGDLESAGSKLRLEAWRQRQVNRGIAANNIEEMFRQLPQSVYFIPERRLEALLAEAGFTGVERFFQALLFGGWIARRTI
jgi:tRNA (cmo5U34)-methyltransferase